MVDFNKIFRASLWITLGVSMSRMKRAYEDFAEDALRFWFPDGMGDISQEEIMKWETKAREVASSVVDRYGVEKVLLETRDRGFADGISVDGD